MPAQIVPRQPKVLGLKAAAVTLAIVSGSAAALAQECGNTGAGFDGWLTRFKGKAAAQGVPSSAIASTLDGVSYDPAVIRLDRGQKSFKLSFEEFYARRVSNALIRRGQGLMRTHAATFDRVEKRFGVPPEIITAIWGLETAYGSDMGGRFSIVRSLARSGANPFTPQEIADQLVGLSRELQRQGAESLSLQE